MDSLRVACKTVLFIGCLLNITQSLPPPYRRGIRLLNSFRQKNFQSRNIFEDSFERYNYTQVLDHFSYTPQSYQTFPQKYIINRSNWGGPQNNSPIFVCLGDESPIEDSLEYFSIPDQVARFKALLIFIEHRYYGDSMPFGGGKAAHANASTMGYLTISQALADFASVIIYLKKSLSGENCPVIVFGASYGGMLASWFRLKYPHVTIGALASSATILDFESITPQYAYSVVVTKDYMDASETCAKIINQTWANIDKVASQPGGLIKLSQQFNTCKVLDNQEILMDWLQSNLASAAQYNFPDVKGICEAIDQVPEAAGSVSKMSAAAKYINGEKCMNTSLQDNPYDPYDGFDWQLCTEIVSPMGDLPDKTIFPPSPFHIKQYMRDCYLQYGVLPRPTWVTTEFGGHDIRRVLKNFGSNIIFSNGLRDPYSSASVLQNMSDTIVAIYTSEGTHCQDVGPSNPDDPIWLTEQRRKEMMIINE